MCLGCLEQWKQCSKDTGATHCPLCRAVLPTDLGICHRLKRTIEQLYPTEVAERRTERRASPAKPSAKPPAPAPAPAPAPVPASSIHYSNQLQALITWQQYAMVSMYYGVNPYQGSDSTIASVGTPVIDHVHQQRSNVEAGAPSFDISLDLAPSLDICHHPVASGSSGQSSEGNSSCPTTPSSPTGEVAPWQTSEDESDRSKMARLITECLRSEGLDAALGPAKLPSAVRFLELSLYRKAPSKEAYLEPCTLARRIVEAVKERAANVRRVKSGPTPAQDAITV